VSYSTATTMAKRIFQREITGSKTCVSYNRW